MQTCKRPLHKFQYESCLEIIICEWFQLNEESFASPWLLQSLRHSKPNHQRNTWKKNLAWCYTHQAGNKVHILCNHWENIPCLWFVASYRDKPPCGAEDFLFCFEYRGFSHISNHTALIADKYHRECHHIKLVCFWTLTISPCNKLETGVHNRLSGFCALQVCIETTQPLWAHKTHRAQIYAKLQGPRGH